MATSKLQRALSLALSAYDYALTIKENYRPDWMINNEGARLELDFFIDELSLAVEVQGIQHYVYVPHFHGEYSNFKLRLKYDEDKKEICKKEGITLLEIDSQDEIDDVLYEIRSRLETKTNLKVKARAEARLPVSRWTHNQRCAAQREYKRVFGIMCQALIYKGGNPNGARSRAIDLAIKVMRIYGPESISLLGTNKQYAFVSTLRLLEEKCNNYREYRHQKYPKELFMSIMNDFSLGLFPKDVSAKYTGRVSTKKAENLYLYYKRQLEELHQDSIMGA